MNNGTWVRLTEGLAVVPIGLVDAFFEGRNEWRYLIAEAVEKGEAVVDVGIAK